MNKTEDKLDLSIATPGSDLAVEHGCKCPIGDNRRGQGWLGNSDTFWINPSCKLHGEFSDGSDED